MAGEEHDIELVDPARAAFWSSLEPSVGQADDFATRVLTTARRRRQLVRGRVRAAAVAACLAASFAGGWVTHAHRESRAQITRGLQATGACRVALTDGSGQVTASQDFDSIDQARAFVRDVERWQEQVNRVRTGAPVVVADRF